MPVKALWVDGEAREQAAEAVDEAETRLLERLQKLFGGWQAMGRLYEKSKSREHLQLRHYRAIKK